MEDINRTIRDLNEAIANVGARDVVATPILGGFTILLGLLHADLPAVGNVKARLQRGLASVIGPAPFEIVEGSVDVERNCYSIRREQTAVLSTEERCDPVETVVVVEIDGARGAGGGASAFGFGGSIVGGNVHFRVVQFRIGPKVIYRYRVRYRETLEVCSDPEETVGAGLASATSTIEILEQRWMEAGVVKDAICGREILAAGIDSFDTAKIVADRQAPEGSSILRSSPRAGLGDQTGNPLPPSTPGGG